MYNLEIYKDMYYYELDAKEKINTRISIPIGITVLLISGLGYLWRIFQKCPNKIWVGVYFITLIIYTISVLLIVISIFLTYCGYSYKYINASYMQSFELSIKRYYDDNYEEYFQENGVPRETLEKNDIQDKLIERYVEATEWNMNMNMKKLKWSRISSIMTTISLSSGLLAYMILIFFYKIN